MKVLFLYSSSKREAFDKAQKGEIPLGGFWGMPYLSEYGIETDFIELEKSLPRAIARKTRQIINKYFNVYFVHVLLFWKIFSYDIVFTSTAFGSQFFHSILGIKKPLWVMHDFSITGLLGRGETLRQKVFRFMVKRSGGVVTLSIFEREKLKEEFPQLKDRIEFIPFGVDLDFFKPQNIKEEAQILGVGMDPDRDWGTLIEATKKLNIKIVLATSAERVKKLEPLPKNVEIKKFSAKDLVREYSKSAIVVIPMDSSGHNNDAMGCSALYEGMAMGKPVVVTRTITTETYIRNGKNGFLVEEKNVEEMRKKIKILLGDESLRKKVGKNALSYAHKNLDARKCAGDLAQFLKKIYLRN